MRKVVLSQWKKTRMVGFFLHMQLNLKSSISEGKMGAMKLWFLLSFPFKGDRKEKKCRNFSLSFSSKPLREKQGWRIKKKVGLIVFEKDSLKTAVIVKNTEQHKKAEVFFFFFQCTFSTLGKQHLFYNGFKRKSQLGKARVMSGMVHKI